MRCLDKVCIDIVHMALKVLPRAFEFSHTVCTVKITAKTNTGSNEKTDKRKHLETETLDANKTQHIL